ncbi:hypothetical protein C8J57DRAFT_1445642 [Mycena rebaudengoi]|nr:hypothetical protein C8J57DRAFT_1445642 [Mycena rebaudengoi]
MLPPIFALPSDILILVVYELSLSVSSLALRPYSDHLALWKVNEFGWAGYRRSHPRPSPSLSNSRKAWTPMAQAKYDVLTDTSWTQSQFFARPLSAPWSAKVQPLLAISNSRLICAAGITIYSYRFGVSSNSDSPPVQLEGSCPLAAHDNNKRYITALAFLPDGGLDQTLCLGFHDGTLERVVLSIRSHTIHVNRYSMAQGPRQKHSLESLSSNHHLLLSLTASTLTHLPPSPSTVELQAKSWVSHLCMQSSSPYAAFGSSSATPLAVHSITNDRLSPIPSAILYQASPTSTGSAVYGICSGPPSSPWGLSPQVLVSGWYNGTVSVHDLRASSRFSSLLTFHSPAPLRPVLTLVNSWSDEPIYSVSCGGGSGSHVAAGSARHSLVSFWDVRYPTKGFSLHAPLNDPSPVYSLVLESSRMFGVTQSRPFVLDFGPGVTGATYPDLGDKHRGGYYVTKYSHRIGA